MVELALVHPQGPNPFHFECKKADGKENRFFQMLGYRGEGMWAPTMFLKNSQDGTPTAYDKIRITAEWKTTENPKCVRNEGKVGIWLPVNDMGTNLDAQGEAHNIGPLRPSNSGLNDALEPIFKAKVLQASWDSGRKATIDITSKSGEYDGIPISMFCVPVWNKEDTECENAELKSQGFGKKRWYTRVSNITGLRDDHLRWLGEKEEDERSPPLALAKPERARK